jgi:hypothetical protein
MKKDRNISVREDKRGLLMNKRISIILVVLMILSSTSAFAANFNDVPANHWASTYISDMQRKGIITGYSDGTFKPNTEVTKLASIKVIYEMLKTNDLLDEEIIEEQVEDYSLTLNRYNVPSWGREAVAFALGEKIIVEAELATFFNADDTLTVASKGEVSVYLGKALKAALEIDFGNTVYSFGFNDEITISFAMAPYVNLLVKNDIVSGDENDNFNTKKPVTRAVLAKMISVADELVADDGEPFYEDSVDDLVVEVQKGIIVLLNEDNKTIVIKDEDDDQEIYKIIDDAIVMINEREEALDDLDEDDEVTLSLNSDGMVIKIGKNAIESYETGEFYNIIGSRNEYLITLKNEAGNKHTFESIDEDRVVFKVNGETVDYDELKKGLSIEKLELNYNNEIEELWLGEETDVYEGILLRGLYYKDKPMIKIRTYGNEELELEVDEDADVEKNNRNRSLSYLTKGDIVRLELDDGIVDEIIATSIEESGEGRIKKIIIAEIPQLVIEDNGNEVTYDIDDDVDIEIDDDDDKDLYDLRLNYKVELDIEGNVIQKIEAESVSDTLNISGFITEIYSDNDVIVVETKDDEVISVSCNDAKIYDDDGDRIGFSKLDEDDEILIFADDNSSLFDYTAKRIYIIKN